jgi:hypothetical protein
MVWNARNTTLFLLGGIAVFFFAHTLISHFLHVYHALSFHVCNTLINLLGSPWVRGEIVTPEWPAVVYFHVPGKYRAGAPLPQYELGYALFLALLIPSPFLGWKRKIVHLFGGVLLITFGLALQIVSVYARAAIEKPGSDLFFEGAFEGAISMVIIFNNHLGPTVLPIIYWLALGPLTLFSDGENEPEKGSPSNRD